MINKFINTIEKFNMLSNGDRVLAGVSGGADSMLMLELLLEIKDKYNLTLAVAHIEHGIRGEASINDAEFVKSFCKNNNIEFHLLSIDAVSESAEFKMSVEEYSRMKRYQFFESFDYDKIATAHNLTDNIETVLFRLSRGTGLNGICGIPAVRGKIIRPLIEVSSKEIREYCDNNGIDYRVDETNLSNDYSRNYIRNIIVKDFNEFNSSFEDNASKFISDINEDYSFITAYVDSVYSQCINENMLIKEQLKVLPPAISKRVIINYFSNNNIPLDRKHLNDIYSLISENGKIQVKGSVYALSDKRHIRVADLNNGKLNKKFETKILRKFEFNPKNIDFYCDYDKINGSVTFRKRMAGDNISPAGRKVTKSLKKLYNEYSVPVELRDDLIVICDEIGIIGVEGICCDERVKLDEDTQNVFILTVSLED